jgi:hypothetical protein
LTVVASGEPAKVSACHCRACKSRTGSSFGVAVFFPEDRVKCEGVSTLFERRGDSGKSVAFHFCPTCGSTVYWLPAFRPGLVAIAIGCFQETAGLAPTQSVYEDLRDPWAAIETTHVPSRP